MKLRSASFCLVASPVLAAALASSVCGQSIKGPSKGASDPFTRSFDGAGGSGGGGFTDT